MMSRFRTGTVFLLGTTLTSLAMAQNDHVSTQRMEYCSQGNLCLTSFDWCQYNPVSTANGTFNTGICDYKGLVDDGFLFSRISSFDISLFYNNYYDLTWINADAGYPVRIDWYFGPNQGVVNNSVPAWSKNVTESFYRFRAFDLINEVSEQYRGTNLSYGGYALGFPNRFVISQPERPAQDGVNATDESNTFRIAPFGVEYYVRDLREGYEDSQANQNRKWRLGVGIGVGLGVPLLMLIAFILGRLVGKKKVGGEGGKVIKDSTAPTKESVDLSDGDRPAAA